MIAKSEVNSVSTKTAEELILLVEENNHVNMQIEESEIKATVAIPRNATDEEVATAANLIKEILELQKSDNPDIESKVLIQESSGSRAGEYYIKSVGHEYWIQLETKDKPANYTGMVNTVDELLRIVRKFLCV